MEMADVYDENRQRTGRQMERHGPRCPGDYRTVVHLCLFDGAGRMLIQQRTESKRIWPGFWDVTVGGGVDAGETSAQALCREVWEELGLQLDPEGLRPVLTMNFDAGFDDFYLLVQSVELSALSLQAEEVQQVRWASLSEIAAMIESGSFIPYPPQFLPMLWELTRRGGCFPTK